MPIYSKPTLVPALATGVTPIYAWTASTAYTSGTVVSKGGSLYRCTTSGTSASSGGPTGTSNSITDGTAVWAYSRPALGAGPAVAPSSTESSSGLTKSSLAEGSGFGVLNYLWQLVNLWVLYLSSLALQAFSWGRVHAFTQTITVTNAKGTAWQATHAYVVDDVRTNDSGKVYICIQAGTSAGSGGPTGTSASITDGTAKWMYVRGPAAAVDAVSTEVGYAALKGTCSVDGGWAVESAGVLYLRNTATPTTPAEGMMWYDTSAHALYVQTNAGTKTVTLA